MNSAHYVEYTHPTEILLPEEDAQIVSTSQLQTTKKYSFEDIRNLVLELEENTYDFFTHKLKIVKNFRAYSKCNIQSCNKDIFDPTKKLILLSCRHIIHEECSRRPFSLSPYCSFCDNYPTALEKYKNVNDFIDKIKLNCIHEDCYFTTQYSILKHYSSEVLTSIFDQILFKKEQNLKAYLAKKFVDEVQQEFANAVYQKGFLPIKERKEVDDLVKDISIDSKIQILPQLNIGKMKQNIAEENEEKCPYPFANYQDKTLNIFLKENQAFLMNFIKKTLQERKYFAGKRFQDPVVFTDTGFEISLLNLCNISSSYRTNLQYNYSDIQASTVTAIDGFKSLIMYLKTELAILDLLYEHKISFHGDIYKVYIKPNWSSIDDFIIIADGERDAKIRLSSFIDTNTGKANIDQLTQEMALQEFNYKDFRTPVNK